MDTLIWGAIASLLAGLGTGLGALPVLLPTHPSERTEGVLLGIGGGVMLAATSFSLIVPGTEAAIALGYPRAIAAMIIVIGVLLGGGLLWVIHDRFPHEHFFKGQEGPKAENLKRIWLFVAAITLHNFPEGLAVGVSFGSGSTSSAIVLALGIAIQNMPEGLVVAWSLRNLEYSALYALGISTLTGLVEPLGGIVGAGIVGIAQEALPWGMAFAAGAMLFVIVDEIIPEISQKSQGQRGTLGLMLGFVTMMFLDIALGQA
ncbi:ZIP family metal transporter [Oscillatoria sp. CS-180]|uniref:ZIP family metal transporter n=1 Tax=Oscillatoria sp. CS-180 TaxID=3021720 RepID=UPI00232AA383|nr:ZIP family metal transporter [Oscillatoria sp. CS-180]MDB9525586.1 ZIP family metal transporter [Oscillatoria sp. CS-180]